MSQVQSKEFLSENVFRMVIKAPRIARKHEAGHFVIIKLDKSGERVPLTIADSDPEKGTITLIVQRVGVTSHKLSLLEKGDEIMDVVGPLGHPTHIENFGTVLCAGGGVGIAPLYPIVKALKKAGNRIITVLAARSKDLLILEEEMKEHSDELLVMTDDGSYGEKGLVTHGMEKLIKTEKPDQAVVIGPAVMMKFASLTTQKHALPTIASLNTIMVDGTGMCGACRVSINGETKFVCVDGPEFPADQIDFDEMLTRLGAYKEEEKKAYDEYLQNLSEA